MATIEDDVQKYQSEDPIRRVRVNFKARGRHAVLNGKPEADSESSSLADLKPPGGNIIKVPAEEFRDCEPNIKVLDCKELQIQKAIQKELSELDGEHFVRRLEHGDADWDWVMGRRSDKPPEFVDRIPSLEQEVRKEVEKRIRQEFEKS